MQQISDWLNILGMPEYAERFAENGVDLTVLPDLTEHDLEKLGVLLGHRRKMLRAIAELGGKAPQSTTKQIREDHAERRQLTIMFCDLVDSTALSIQLDPEQLQRVIAKYHRQCAEIVAKFDGFIAKYLGDGVLGYFGYPQAHEDDAERAVRAGLALTDAVAKLDVGMGAVLRARVGIATGLVVVGQLVRHESSLEQEVAGVTPNLAARLQELAEPGAVLIDNSTHRLLGELFEYRTRGPVSIKGFREPLTIWEVLGEGLISSRFEAMRTAIMPLVGREEEVDLLTRRWQRAKAGEGCVVLISGEPGIGKSRLVQNMLDRLVSEPHHQICYFCSTHHQDSALYPVITQFQLAANIQREESAEERLNKVKLALTQANSELSAATPLIATLLHIRTTGAYAPVNLSPQKQREKTLTALLGHIQGLAVQLPLVLVLEDAQWCDPTTHELVDLIVERAPTQPILVLITFRPEFAARWVGLPQVTMVTLNRLSRHERSLMISHVARGKSLPKEIAEQIIDRTDGVPLFIEELTKAVIESGALTDKGGNYEITGPSPPVAIPTSLNASLLARLDRLASVRGVAQLASALGRTFSHELIAATSIIPQKELEEALSKLLSSELIFRRGNPPDAEYTFKHALVQNAAYSTLLHADRQQLHSRIAAVLQARFPDVVEMQPEVLAHHCAEAGLVQKAAGFSLKAGRHAIARGAMIEAVTQLRKGLDGLSLVSDKDEYQEQELNLQMALGHALLATKGYGAPEPLEAFARARDLCERIGRSPQLGPVLISQFSHRCARGELGKAEQLAAEIRRLGDTENNPIWKCFGASSEGCVCLFLGNFIDARAYFEDYLSLWDPKYRTYVAAPGDGYVTILCYISRTLAYQGYLDQARVRRDQALAEARRLSPYNLAFALCNAWYSDWAIQGRNIAPSMNPAVEEVLRISAELGLPLYAGFGKIMQGWCLGAIGQAADGIPILLQGIAMVRATGSKLSLPFFLMTLAEVCGKAGRPEEGLDRLDEAAELLDLTQERWAEAEMHRLRGTLYLSMRNAAGAEDSFRQALDVARRQSAHFWTLRASLELARLWRGQNKKAEALALLSPIYTSFREGFDTPAVQEARTLLWQLA